MLVQHAHQADVTMSSKLTRRGSIQQDALDFKISKSAITHSALILGDGLQV